MKAIHLFLVPSMLCLAACGIDKTDRAATGALIGAGAGAVIGSTIGHGGAGALIGAGAGAAAGAAIDPKKVDLGKPVWR